MSDEESKVSRREFIKFSAFTSVSAAGLYAISVKTDVLAQELMVGPPGPNQNGEMHSYTYTDEIP